MILKEVKRNKSLLWSFLNVEVDIRNQYRNLNHNNRLALRLNIIHFYIFSYCSTYEDFYLQVQQRSTMRVCIVRSYFSCHRHVISQFSPTYVH